MTYDSNKRRERYLKNRETYLEKCKEYRNRPERKNADHQRYEKNRKQRIAKAVHNRRERMKNPEKRAADLATKLAYNKKRSDEFYAILNERKLKNPCPCGEADPCCLVFHHRDPTKKDKGIAHMSTMSRERILAELDKCDVLCSNCHLKLHERLRLEKRLTSL